MCHTKRCKYECWKGLCTIKGRIPNDALCMTEHDEPEASKKRKRANKKA